MTHWERSPPFWCLCVLTAAFSVLLTPRPEMGRTSGTAEAASVTVRPPLLFTSNEGQADERVRFLGQVPGFSVAFTSEGPTFRLGQGEPLHLRLVGARDGTVVEGRRKRAGTVNYLIGNDPDKWLRGLSTYGEVVYREPWPGIDLAFRGDRGRVKYEFRVQPGAEVENIRLRYEGANRPTLDAEGNLRIETAAGVLVDERPRSYQEIDGKRVAVESRFALDAGSFTIAVGDHDPRHALVIDPGLEYSTSVGASGAGGDIPYSITVDGLGYAYVGGYSNGTGWPTTPGAPDQTFSNGEGFVCKLNRDGSDLIYSTYLGGTALDQVFGIAVDSSGNAVVTGWTKSADFPTTPGALDESYNGDLDAFVTKLDPTGANLVYSTYLGGSRREGAPVGDGQDRGSAVAVDAGGNAYVTGKTHGLGFPTTAGAYDVTRNGPEIFITKLGPTGTLVFSTFLGGTDLGQGEEGRGLVFDSAGNIVVGGWTGTSNFPATGFQLSRAGYSKDGFVAKLTPDGSALLCATYLGGATGTNLGYGVGIDSADNVYLCGFTASTDFPITPGAVDSVNSPAPGPSFLAGDAFVAKFDPTLSNLVYSTFLGGSGAVSRGGGNEKALGIAVSPAGRAHVVGGTDSTDIPTTPDAISTMNS